MSDPAPIRTPDRHDGHRGDRATSAVRYVALGDSSTEGLCDPDGSGGWIGWSQRLAHRFARQQGEIMWANLAVRGLTCREILTTQLADAVGLQPTHATVFGGMNDLIRVIRPIEDTIDDLTTMLRTMQATGATVATLTIPDLSAVVRIARPLRSRVHQLNEAIRATADDGVIVVDIANSPIAGDERLWADDRLHANSEGHRRIAVALADAFGLPSEQWDARPFDRDPINWNRHDHREWVRDHLYPWILRRIRREASGEGIEARHPEWVRISASDDLATIAASSGETADDLDGIATDGPARAAAS